VKRVAFYLLLIALFASGPAAAAGNADFDSWVGRDLLPYVTTELSTSPRFRNESFRFVLMSADTPQSEGTALAFYLRDRLREAANELTEIRVAWLSDQPGAGLASADGHLDCTRNDADYLVGIELNELSPGVVDIKVGALDVAEREWVPGFSRTWRGPVSGRHRVNLNRFESDPTFRGERDAPWEDNETDLMATHLAYELGCKLLSQTRGEYVVAAHDINGDVDATTALVELVGNNLAGVRALQFAAGNTNAVLEGKAHRIDDDLFQYWITITPTDPESEMRALSADAYVRIPDTYRAATLVPGERFSLAPDPDGFIRAMGIVRLPDVRACADASTGYSRVSGRPGASSDCFAVQVAADDDAISFVLVHQQNHGLVRLGDRQCGDRAMAKVARAGERLRFALPIDAIHSGDWTSSADWSLTPRADSWYVLAANDSRAGRALARHIEELPVRCSASVRPGFEGQSLSNWLKALDDIIEHWSPAIDWRSIQVEDVY
jgi:hypothetical protein